MSEIKEYFKSKLHAEDYLATRWYPESEKDPFRSQRTQCREDIVNFIKDKFKNPTVLDAGAGTGRLAISLTLAGARVTAIDISENILSIAVEEAEKAGVKDRITWAIGDVERLQFGPNTFDVVCSVEVFEHVTKPLETLKGLLEISKHCVILTVPSSDKVRAGNPLIPSKLRPVVNFLFEHVKPLTFLVSRVRSHPIPRYSVPLCKLWSREEILNLARLSGGMVEKVLTYQKSSWDVLYTVVIRKQESSLV